MQEIAEGVVVSTEFRRITVGAIVTGRGIVCVDVPPYPDDAQRWQAMLLERFKQPIRAVVLTDSHRDRLPGLHWFDTATIVAHTATFYAMKALPNAFMDQMADALSMDSRERSSFVGVKLRLPRVTFDDRMTIYVEDVGVPLLAMPGPTPGNVWVHLPDQRVVFTGDSVVLNQPLVMGQAQSKAWLNSLTLLRRPRFAADVVVPGRGPVTDKDSTQAISEFLRYLRRRVQRLYRSGHPRSDIANIVPGIMAQLTCPPGDEEDVQRRLKTGLESIYDEFRLEEEQEKQR